MKDQKKVWAWVGAVIFAGVVAVWVVSTQGAPMTTTPPAPSGPTPVYALQGQLTPQFPKDLVFGASAAINDSYSINYSTSTNQYTAEYNSSSTVTALYKQYTSYLPANGWKITGTLTTHPSFDMISAAQDNAQLQVVISTNGSGSQASITYVAK
jgi:hypothetical protein